MVVVQVVVGPAAGVLGAGMVGLPQRLRAPIRTRLPAIGLGCFPIRIQLRQQSLSAIYEPCGLTTLPRPQRLADAPPKRVVLVASDELPILLHGDPALCGVIDVGGDAAVARGALDMTRGGVVIAHEVSTQAPLSQAVAAGVLPFTGLVQAADAVVNGVVAVLLLGQAQAGQAGAGARLGQAVQRVVSVINRAVDIGAQLQRLACDAALDVVLIAQRQEVGVGSSLDLDALDSVEAVVGNASAGARVLDLGGQHPLVVGPCDLVGAARLGGLLQVALVVAECGGAAVRVALAGFAAIGIPALGQGGGDAVGAVTVDQLLLTDAAQGVTAVVGLADELAAAILLFVAGKAASLVITVGDAAAQARLPGLRAGAGEQGQQAIAVVGVVADISCRVGFFYQIFYSFGTYISTDSFGTQKL